MSKKFYVALIYFISLCMILSFSVVSAGSSVEVLIYTGKISVTSQDEIPTTYAMPQEVTELPGNTIIECIDGVAIFKVGEVQIILGTSDKVQLSSAGETEKVNMICIHGEIEALWGDDLFKIDEGQTLGLNSEGFPIAEKEDAVDVPKLDTQDQISSPVIMPPDPDETLYTSRHF